MNNLNNILADCRAFSSVHIDELLFLSCHHRRPPPSPPSRSPKVAELKLYAKRKKCSFAQDDIKFCVLLVHREGVRTHPDKVQIIANWPTPTSAKDILSFLGLAGFYQWFLLNFANHAATLRLTNEERQVALGKPPLSCVRRPSSRITALNGVRAPIFETPVCRPHGRVRICYWYNAVAGK